MQRREGIHFYVDVMNLAEVVVDEEERTGGVKHSIHALDTLFSSIERFGKAGSGALVVEKVTESRLHMYVVGDVAEAFCVVSSVAAYAYEVCRFLNGHIAKYKTLADLVVRVGAAFGEFYETQFEFPEAGRDPELTTIGYAANYAAKLQGTTGEWAMSISKDIYAAAEAGQRRCFSRVARGDLRKYGQSCCYVAHLSDVSTGYSLPEDELRAVNDYANTVSLGNMELSAVRRPLSFDRLNRTTVKKLDGITLYADVRGFTKMFDPDGGNLDEMAAKTQQVLATLYGISTKHGGVHVQFQGDRELAVFHNVSPYTDSGGSRHEGMRCYKDAVLTAMRMIDGVRGIGLYVGVGEAFGTLYATKIGARGERDNVLIGSTIIEAGRMEDQYAGENQVAITQGVYEGLCEEDKVLAGRFGRSGGFWVSTVGYEQHRRDVERRLLSTDTFRRSYNGAYGELSEMRVGGVGRTSCG